MLPPAIAVGVMVHVGILLVYCRRGLRPEAPNRKQTPMKGKEQVVVLRLKMQVENGL